MEIQGRPAARKGDATEHGAPLGDGPGSPNVLIGGARAWRGDEEKEEEEEEEGEGEEGEEGAAAEGEAGEGEAAGKAAEGAGEAAGKAAEGAGEAAGSSLSELIEKLEGIQDKGKALIEVINAAKELAKKEKPEEEAPEDIGPPEGWPPEEPDTSYEKGFELGKSIYELVMELKKSFAPAEPDEHACEEPGHGSGKVKDGSKAVLINELPACRKGDHVSEEGGGEDEIVEGCDSVLIGEENKVLELAEKIGGLIELVKAAKELFAKEEEPPAEGGEGGSDGGSDEGAPAQA
ncbi:MAG: hypothetical protein U0359_25475 [Byssovorax sp.]